MLPISSSAARSSPQRAQPVPLHFIPQAQVNAMQRKLHILADAAKYDASCASSGAGERDSRGGTGLGSTSSMGICHSFTPDGRCIALLKILLTNYCLFDCAYCINRKSSNVPRARFTPQEVVNLTLDFYRRNTIEGLFLSSGIIQSPNYTMQQLVDVARALRQQHDFRGYIHLKTIPDADAELLYEAGRWADRLSINIELPTQQALAQLAPEKKVDSIVHSMRATHEHIAQHKQAQLEYRQRSKLITNQSRAPLSKPPRFAPSGQSTQMIIGADASDDRTVLRTTDFLYRQLRMRRVYYSAFSPIPDASAQLPLQAPPLLREHRLYQADWLLRFYGFTVDEIAPAHGQQAGMLDLELDPKLQWALNNRHFFPVDLQSAPREALLRVPGLGKQSVAKILATRRVRTLCLADLARLRNFSKVQAFVAVSDHHPGKQLDSARLRQQLLAPTGLKKRQALEQAQQQAQRHAQQVGTLLKDSTPLAARTRKGRAVGWGQQADLFGAVHNK